MSALGAIVMTRGGDPSREMLTRMANALRLHGPDRSGQRLLDGAGLVSALMLGFVPQDRLERQPLAAAGRLHIVFTGWLSNHREMLDLLGLSTSQGDDLPDSALALRAWERWDTAALDRLDGDFAFAVWDEQKRALCCARSILQAPPVHYHVGGDRIAVASFPKGLFALGDIEREIDEVAIADSLVLNYEDVERSYFRDIRRLPLGCFMRVDADGVRVTRYYDPDRAPDVRFARDQDYVDAANEHLARATADCLRANETPAVSLSSGLDSPSVAVSAIEELRGRGGALAFPLVGFTSVPEAGWDKRTYGKRFSGDESAPVRALGRMYPELEVNFLDSAGQDADAYLDQLFLLSEVPPRNTGNLYWPIDISKATRARGKRVLLTGFNGNATISLEGAGRFPELLKQGRLIELVRELRLSALPDSRFGSVFKKAIAPVLPNRMYRAIMQRRGLLHEAPWHSYSAISPQWAAEMKLEQRLQDTGWDATYQPPATQRDYIKTILVGGTRDVGQSVRYGIQALTGVQDRDPLADRRLTEFCLGLPVEQYLYRGTDRRLVRRMMAERLPPEVLDAPFGRQGADWHLRITRRLARYREELERLEGDAEAAGRLDLPRLRTLLDTWPTQTPLSTVDHPDHLIAWYGMGRAVGTARFIRWVRGANG